MQDPLKNNKAFKESYLSYQAHKRYLTPYNVDTLVYSLHQIRDSINNDRESQSKEVESGFVDSYLHSTILPTVNHKPLVAEVKPWMKPTKLSPCESFTTADSRHSKITESRSWEKPSVTISDNNHYYSRTSVTADHTLRGPPSITTRINKEYTTRTNTRHVESTRHIDYTTRSNDHTTSRSNDHTTSRSNDHTTSRINDYTRTTGRSGLHHDHGRRGMTYCKGGDSRGARYSQEIPKLESSLSLKTTPSDATLPIRCSLSVSDDLSDDNNDDEDDYSNEVDSGWQDQEDEELLSDIEEDEVHNYERWDFESTEGDTDSGHFQSGSLSPLHESVPSMIPPRLTYPGESDSGVTSPLTPSAFNNLPPTIHFPLPTENYRPLSSRQKSLLKWKLSTITPNVIKHILDKVGFTYTTKGSDWIGYWGKHMKPEAFRSIQPHQKVNHLPGSFQIGRKDRLWRNLSKMQAHFGRKEFGFVPQTFVLPNDIRQFKRTWEEKYSHKQKWIIKPPASARGIGIQVVHKWSQIPKKRPIIVQQYLSDPYLINDSKFDLRIYVYVNCIDPLTIYIYRDGLVRFATKKYSQSTKTLSNRFVHLTNYSINKKSADFKANSDETQCFGHKWGLLALWEHMEKNLGIDPRPVWAKIKDLVIKTMLSCEGYIASLVKANCRDSNVTHELFGFDIMLDRQLKPWLLEVNVSPSLHSNSRLDFNIKGHLMRDLLNMACFHMPQGSASVSKDLLTSKERSKHSYYSRLSPSQEYERRGILTDITRHDYRILTRYIDQNERRGGFVPVYPTLETIGKYRQFFQYERYNNILIEEWLKQYSKRPDKGIEYLNSITILS